jgi:hypothetical protein
VGRDDSVIGSGWVLSILLVIWEISELQELLNVPNGTRQMGETAPLPERICRAYFFIFFYAPANYNNNDGRFVFHGR